MRKIIHSFTLLLFAWVLLLAGTQEAHASHLLGGDMTYVSLGNNQYRVKFRLYRDCSGILPSPFTLSCKNGGCNATATVSADFIQQGAVEAGNPFCAAASSGPCQGPAGLPNYDVYNYLATVTLPPGNWILSTSQGSRPLIANAVDGNLYVEATLNNTNQGATAVSNNSPQFDPQDIPIQYVCWKQPTTVSYSSTEADGDSLVYSLAAPLQDCGTPVTYKTYPATPAVLVAIPGTNPTCFFNDPGRPGGTYSATNPILLGLDTVGTCPVKNGAVRTLRFNQQSRTLTFTPGVFNAAALPSAGDNKYQIAVLITEYRRINGVRRVIGTVRREANIIVIDCGANKTPRNPTVDPRTPNSGTQTVNTTDTTRIDVRSCNYSRVELNFTDPDNLTTPSANQHLTVTLPPNINTDPNLLDSGDVGTFSLSLNGTTNPKGVFFFQPSPNTVGRTIRLNIKIEDDACPIKGVQNRVVVIRIFKGNTATAAATIGSPGIPGTPPNSICAGGSLTIQGNVLRPDSIRRIAANTTQRQIYSYQWTASVGGSGLPAVTNTQNITVSPTVTTRYRLFIAPTIGFAQGLCGDTTSIVVRVVPPPVVRATTAIRQVCAGSSVQLTGNATRPNGPTGLNDTYTYNWTGPGIATAGRQGQTVTVTPTTLGLNVYTVTANGQAPYGCTATDTVRVTVVPPPVVVGSLVNPSLQQVCAGGAVALNATATRPTGVGSTLPDTYTYTWTGPGLPTAGTAGSTVTVRPTTLGVNKYVVTATGLSRFNCSNTDTVRITVVPPPVVSATPNLPQVCAGAPVQLTADAVRPTGTGSTLPDTYTYTWSGPGVPANASGKTFTVTPTTLGVNTYTVTATGQSQFNCSNTSTVQVTVVPPPTVTVNNAVTCPGGTAILTATAVNQSLADVYTYTWTGGNLPAGTTGATITVSPSGNTTYTVTATGRAQTGCAAVGTVQVQTPPALVVDFDASDALDANNRPASKPPVVFTFKNTTNVANQVVGSTYTYTWTYQRIADAANNAVGLETPTTFSTTATPNPLTLEVPGTYRIRLTGNANLAGGTCAPAIKERLIVVPDTQVPNIITPNGDGQNDFFRISSAPTTSKLEIFNRWGRKVYEQTNYQNNWGGDNQPAGVYYFLLTKSNGAQTKGWIEVVK